MRQTRPVSVIRAWGDKIIFLMSLHVLSSAELKLLWRKHAASLLLMARSRCGSAAQGLADDCVQEAFIRLAVQHPVPQDAAAWLMTVVRHAAIDAARSERRRGEHELAAGRERPAWLSSVSDGVDGDSETLEIERLLCELEPTTRDIVVAHVWGSLTFRQIAAVVELSPATVHRRYEDGLSWLRDRLRQVEQMETGKP